MSLLNVSDLDKSEFFLTNWKSYQDESAIQKFLADVASASDAENIINLISLPYPILKKFSKQKEYSNVKFGCSHMNSVNEGSFTRSIAGEILKNAGATFVLLGSAQSRLLEKETNTSINHKIHSAIQAGITPILMVGESLQEMQGGKRESLVSEQLREGLKALSEDQLANLILVFESPWLDNIAFKPNTEILQKSYQEYRNILEKILEEKSKLVKILYNMPFDVEDPSQFFSGNGYFSSQPETFFHIIKTVSSGAASLKKMPIEEQLIDNNLSSTKKEEKPLEEYSEVKNNDKPSEKKTEAKKEEHEPEETLAPSKQGIKEEENIEEQETFEEEKKEIEKEIVEAPKETGRSKTEAKNLVPEEELGELEESVEAVNDLEDEEGTVEGDKGDEGDEEALKEEPLSERDQALLEVLEKLESLEKKDRALAECYNLIKGKGESLPILRKEFTGLVEQYKIESAKIDPVIREQIDKGNIEYFQSNPDKADEARFVLQIVNKMRQYAMQASQIPKDVDRLQSKGREIRKELEKEWDYFNKNRKELKDKFPEVKFPTTPEQLKNKEPVVDLSVPQPDIKNSSLVKKQITRVNLSKPKA